MKKIFIKLAKYYWTFIAPIYSKNRRAQSPTRNVLLFKTDGLGDFFLLVPFIQSLYRQQYNVICVGNKQCRDIVNHLKLPIVFIDLDTSSVNGFKKTISSVNKYSYDFAFNLSMNIWGGFVINQSFSTIKIGLLQERKYYVYKGSNLFYDKKVSYPSATHNFKVLENLFYETIRLQHVPKEITTTQQNKGYILIHPYSTWKPKIWPYYSDLIQTLSNQGHTIHVIGIDQEHRTNEWLNNFSHSENVKIITLTSLDMLLDEIENSKSFIGNDSGPAHYSALIGKPSTVLWGGAPFERIHPVGKNVQFCKIDVDCRPCRHRGDTCLRGDNECLKKISVNDVLGIFDNEIPEHN